MGQHLRVWVPRLLLALIFLFEGAAKFSNSHLWQTVFSRIGFGDWFRYATGVIEIVGAVLLVIPGATRPGIALLGATMVGALATHAFVIGIGPQTVIVLVLLALLTLTWRQARTLGN